MRSQEAGVVTHQSQESLFKRAAAVSRETQCMLLLAWAGVLSLVSTSASFFVPVKHELLRSLAGMPTAVLAGSISLAGAVYFLVKFILTKKWSCALAGCAFWMLACGTVLQELADARMESTSGGMLINASWVVAGLILAAAGPSRAIMQSLGRTAAILRAAVFATVCFGVPAAIGWCLYHKAVLSTITYALAPVYPGTMLRILLEMGALCALGMAMISQYRRYHDHTDRVSGVLCYFMVPCALSLIYRGIAEAGLMEALDGSRLFALASWPVLALGFGVDTAVEQTEMSARLDELETLHYVSWSVVGTQNLSELLQNLSESLRDRLNASVVTIYLAGDTPDSLKVAAASGPDGPIDDIGKQFSVTSSDRRPGFHTGHTAKAFTSGVVQTARNVFVDVELVNWRVVGREDGCAVSLPMTDSEGTLGVITLYFSDYKQLTKPRITLLATLASAATPAIRNVRNGSVRRLADWQKDDKLDMAA